MSRFWITGNCPKVKRSIYETSLENRNKTFLHQVSRTVLHTGDNLEHFLEKESMPAILAPAKKCCDREKKRSAGTIRAEEEI
jgi:hypothetical protein